MTDITTRAGKGAPLTHDEVDQNFLNLKETADAAFDAVAGVGGKANAAAIGVDDSATDLGTFTGSTIPDGSTAKGALQALETAVDAFDASKEDAITAGTTGQYWRGDKSWQTLDKAAVGLSNVDNTSDAAKPVSTAQQAALDAKAPINNPTFTGTVGGITKAMVGLGNVDNTSDANKPISTATQTALNAKEPTVSAGTTSQYYRGDKSWQTLDKTAVGLANVDNTSDLNKPISTATQTALNARTTIVANRTALASLATTADNVFLKESGREGQFVWSSSNLSTQVTADQGQGIYVPPASDTTGASGAWVRRFSGPVFPTWFGAVGDGTTSDQTAFSSMAAYANANPGTEISLGAKTYRITATVTFTASVSVFGVLPEVSKILCVDNAGLIFDGGTGSTIFAAKQSSVRRVRFVQSGTNSDAPISMIYDASADTRGTIAAGGIDEVEIRVADTSSQFAIGLKLRDTPNGYVNRVTVEGARVSPLTSAIGVKLYSTSGNGSASDPIFDKLKCFYVQTGLQISDEVEGFSGHHILMIAVRTGIKWDAGNAAFQPGFTLTDSHINAEGRCLDLRNVTEIIAKGNRLYGQGVDGTTTEHYAFNFAFDTGLAGSRLNLQVIANMFQGTLNYGEPSDRVTQAIRITGDDTAVENAILDANIFQNYDTGVYIGANVNGITISDTNQYNNCTTNVSDNASNGANIISVLTENGTHWQRKFNDGFITKGGSLTVPLTADGDGVIGLNGAGNNFPNALFAGAIVCNGDNGVAADASFVTQHAVSTASLLYFSVRPNPGAVTVRVQYLAHGR